LTYDLSKSATVYASYTSIFNPQDAKDRSGNYLDPIIGKSVEIGLKTASMTANSIRHSRSSESNKTTWHKPMALSWCRSRWIRRITARPAPPVPASRWMFQVKLRRAGMSLPVTPITRHRKLLAKPSIRISHVLCSACSRLIVCPAVGVI